MSNNTMGNINGNQGIITQGQQGNNTIIQGPVPRHLLDADKAALLAHLPKGRTIRVLFQQTESDGEGLAKEIHDFLVQNGFNSTGYGGVMMFPTPRGTEVNLNENSPNQPIFINVGIR